MKLPKIKNPLSIFAMFAGLVEVACGTLAAITINNNQVLLIWFVVLFPVLLLILFFVTLNFNHKVLYSPEDFKGSESTVLGLFYGKPAYPIIETEHETTKLGIENKSECLVYTNFNGDQDTVSEDDKLINNFIKGLIIYIGKILPSDKLEEVWFDQINKNYLFIAIKSRIEFTKENTNPRHMFVILLQENEKYNEIPKGDIYGVIGGSGLDAEKGTQTNIGNYIIESVVTNLKP
jgi:hypothetical protein